MRRTGRSRFAQPYPPREAVRWIGGGVDVIENVPADRMITITESAQQYLAELLAKQEDALGVRVFGPVPFPAFTSDTCQGDSGGPLVLRLDSGLALKPAGCLHGRVPRRPRPGGRRRRVRRAGWRRESSRRPPKHECSTP